MENVHLLDEDDVLEQIEIAEFYRKMYGEPADKDAEGDFNMQPSV